MDSLSVDDVMSELRDRMHVRLRAEMLRHGASPSLQDPALFAEVEQLLHDAAAHSQAPALLLPEILGEPDTWRLDTAMHFRSHRRSWKASLILFVKRSVLMPMFRWLFEYSRDNFERQRRVNDVLFACVQDLAAETAQLRREVRRLSR